MSKRALRLVPLVTLISGTVAAQTPAGPEFQVNTYTTGAQVAQSSAMAKDGSFVIVWTADDVVGRANVFARRYDPAGLAQGTEFRVNTQTTAHHRTARVASRPGGDFVIVWGRHAPQTGISFGVYGQRYTAGGLALGGEFRVNTYTSGSSSAQEPSVAMADDGRFVVVWDSFRTDGSNSQVIARLYDRNGNARGGEIAVNTWTPGPQHRPAVASDAHGNFTVVWPGEGIGDPYGIFARRFDRDGQPLSQDIPVNSTTFFLQFNPSHAMAPGGDFVVVWQSFLSNNYIQNFAQRFDAGGNRAGGEFALSNVGDDGRPAVGVDGAGNFVVSWDAGFTASEDVYGRRFRADGTPREGQFRVNTHTTGRQSGAALAVGRSGNYVVAFTDGAGHDGSSAGAFAQRFGGLDPTALAVDAPDNGVFEPGETVGVEPSWRNVNGAAQAFQGALSRFTGPGPATYEILDGVADYGTVANGLVGSCTFVPDCFRLRATAPSRPAPHWDATVREDLSPDRQGQTQTWVLHIGDSFADTPRTNPFYRFVETLFHHGVTGGCNATQYCPATSATREQMAVFVLVAKEGTGYLPPACTAPVFADVPASSPFCRWIEELARRSVVSGCGGGNYCPSSAVTREQMATFVLRTLDPVFDPPACGTPVFADVPASSPFCKWIEELARRGVVTGCGGVNYCPAAAVTREQMGVFISATFGLTLYAP